MYIFYSNKRLLKVLYNFKKRCPSEPVRSKIMIPDYHV